VNGQGVLLAKGVPWPPSVEDFYLPGWLYPWVTKFTVMVWLAVAVIILLYLYAYRDPKLVPSRRQWLAESVYGFGRDGLSVDVIGHEGVKFAPYLTSLLSFVLVLNLFGVLPFFQISPNSHIAFPAVLAILTWILYNYVGVRKHGVLRYLKLMTMPPAPWPLYFLLVPLEFISNFLLRPFTLSIRLFANMFAGHFILLVFTLGGFVLFNAGALFAPISIVSWLMAIVLTFLELLVAALQAYVFAILTAVYVQQSLADEH
jgi:F-type H+-transporting ATPase subunit a